MPDYQEAPMTFQTFEQKMGNPFEEKPEAGKAHAPAKGEL
jgi:hypothetical protein